jgi:hypothetical protein
MKIKIAQTVILATAALATTAWAQGLRTQNFDSEASAQSDGWYENRSRTEGLNNFGFTNRTEFWDTTAGEAGGIFNRCTNTCFYGTTNLGAYFSLTNLMHGEGKLAITAWGSAMDMPVYFSYFKFADAGLNASRDACGFTVQEPHGAFNPTMLRCKPTILLADGTRRDPPIENGAQSKTAIFLGPGLYKWSFDFTPNLATGAGSLTITVWTNTGALIRSMTCNLQAGDATANSPVFDSFGIYRPGSGPGDYQSSTNVNNWAKLYVDNLKFTDSQSLPCIEQSPSALVVAVGQTNRTITVTIPSQLNAAQTVTLTVRSLNPSIAVPTGGTDATLSLVYPAGTTNVQSFDITGVSPGVAFFDLTNAYNVCLTSPVEVYVPPAPQMTIVKTQAFDTVSSAAAGAWAEYGSRANGDNYGFSNSSLAGGAGAGEAGGTFGSGTNGSSYGDTFTPALTLNDAFSANGKFALLGIPTTNNSIRIGHFNSIPRNGFPTNSGRSSIGFDIAEPNSSSFGQARLSAIVVYADGTSQRSLIFSPSVGQPYNWSYEYSPTDNGKLTVILDNGLGQSTTNTINLTAPNRLIGASFDSFGINHIGFATNNVDTAQAYIDEVVYSAIPTPLQIQRIEDLGTSLRLTFTTPQPGQTHQVKDSANLSSILGSWGTLSGVTFGGTSSPLTATFAKPSGSTHFYRIYLP